MEEMLVARGRYDRSALFEATDCHSLAPFPGTKGGIWILTPNMSFVPELPMLPEGATFGYYGDGMLGAFEHLKWPQVYYEK